jgi:hypothetical protein
LNPLEADPKHIRPLPKSLVGASCDACGKLGSKWCVFLDSENMSPVCSLCYLSKSGWAVSKEDHITKLVLATEERIGSPFQKDSSGRLVQMNDADRILFALACVDRFGTFMRFVEKVKKDV